MERIESVLEELGVKYELYKPDEILRTEFEKKCDSIDAQYESADEFTKDFLAFRSVQRLRDTYKQMLEDEERESYDEPRDHGYLYYLRNCVRLLEPIEEDLRSDLFG